MVQPLVWLLIFDLIVCVVWWLVSYFGVTAPDPLYKLMIGLVVLINVVIIVFWLLTLTGHGDFMTGPQFRR